jgi:hypothetical protein
MFRYKLRTLLIVMALGPPLLALACWAWTSMDWRTYLRPTVAARKYEWDAARSLNYGSPRTMAGERHAELRYKREDELARRESTVYRVLVPRVP